MKGFSKVIFGSIFLFLIVGCSTKNREGIDPQPESKADSDIQKSFQFHRAQNANSSSSSNSNSNSVTNEVAQNLKSEDQFRVRISRTALGKDFLLSANLLAQTPTPAFSSLQSRVVRFLYREQKLVLLDVTKNNEVGDENIPQTLLLAIFPIRSQDEESFDLDLSAGLKSIFTASDMFSSDDKDYAGANYDLPLAEVRLTYTDEVRWNENSLFIRQVAQLEATSEKGIKAIPVELRLQLKPYAPAADFKPVLSPGFSQVGYFEASPLLLKDGSTRLYAMKWNENKPIVFSLSANTPEKYRELFRSAILSWNKILGAGRVQVEQLKDPSITAPQFDKNVIQWVDFNAAGYAYADAHLDPRSGEVTSAQVFIPSAFFEVNMAARLRSLSLLNEQPTLRLGLKGFQSSALCRRNLFKELAEGPSENKDFLNMPEEAQQKVIEFYVWEVLAHEVGHVLGLRHNFAGNLAASYDAQERPQIMRDFYKTLNAPTDLITTSSVMEYSRFEESAWNGNRLQREATPALSYDKMALEHLYFGIKIPSKNRPAFCTDSQIAEFTDCTMHDAGRSVVSSALSSYREGLKSLAAKILNQYIAQTQTPEELAKEPIAVEDVDLNAEKLAKDLSLEFAKVVSLLKSKQKFVAVRSEFLPSRQNEESDLVEKENQYLITEFDKLGGLEKALESLSDNFETTLIANFEKLITDKTMTSGTRRDGSKFLLSESDLVEMRSQVASLAPRLKEVLLNNELSALAGEDFSFESSYGQPKPESKLGWKDNLLTEKLSDLLLTKFQKFSLGKSDKSLKATINLKGGESKSVDLPIYTYAFATRLLAAKLLTNDHESIDWGYLQKQKQSDLMTAELSILGEDDKIDKASLSKDALKWYLTNKKLQSVLAE